MYWRLYRLNRWHIGLPLSLDLLLDITNLLISVLYTRIQLVQLFNLNTKRSLLPQERQPLYHGSWPLIICCANLNSYLAYLLGLVLCQFLQAIL